MSERRCIRCGLALPDSEGDSCLCDSCMDREDKAKDKDKARDESGWKPRGQWTRAIEEKGYEVLAKTPLGDFVLAEKGKSSELLRRVAGAKGSNFIPVAACYGPNRREIALIVVEGLTRVKRKRGRPRKGKADKP